MLFTKEYKIYSMFCEKNGHKAERFVKTVSEQKLQVPVSVEEHPSYQTEVAVWKLNFLSDVRVRSVLIKLTSSYISLKQ